MKHCIYGAFALFAALSANSVEARDCGCPPHQIIHHTVVRHAPARHQVHVLHEDADAEYAQSFYDYHSTSTVEEVITSTLEEHGPWQIARDDAHIRFHHRREFDAASFNGSVGDYEGAAAYGGYGNRSGFVDGYGETHFDLNGPSYNSYGESFQAGQASFDSGRGGVGPNMRRGGGMGR